VKATRALASVVLFLILFLGPAGEAEPIQALAKAPNRPNIILVVTDDQDAASIRHMPILNSNLVERGTNTVPVY